MNEKVKFVVKVVIRELGSGFIYIPVRELDNLVLAQATVRSLRESNPNVVFCIDIES